MIIWTCPICKTDDLTLRYSSGKMRTCKDCQKYKNIQKIVPSKEKEKNSSSRYHPRRIFYMDKI